jgi:O-antigen ligase
MHLAQRVQHQFPGFYFLSILIVPLLSEAGVLVLALMGLWALMPWASQTPGALTWRRQDSLISICIVSVFVFKMVSALWSDQPYLAVRNALWHTHILLWPLVLLGLGRCHPQSEQIEKSIAWGLIVTGCWYALDRVLSTQDPTRPFFEAGTTGYQQLGQLTLVLGALNFLVLTRSQAARRRWLFAFGLLATMAILHGTSRRIEMAAFGLIIILTIAYRIWHRLSRMQVLSILIATTCAIAIVASLRFDLYLQAINEALQFSALRHDDIAVTQTSIGGRLEMYRLAFLAFCEKPWLGWGAGIRPHQLSQFGAPPLEMFTHRHFHSEYLQTLVEGGVIWALLFATSLAYIARQWLFKPSESQREIVLLAAAVMLAYGLEGIFSSALVYGPSNGLLVVCTAWIWLQLRQDTAL